MGLFDDINADFTLETVTDDDIEEHIKRLNSYESDEEDRTQIREVMKGWKFLVHIFDSSA